MRAHHGSSAGAHRRAILYWTATLLLAAELLVGGAWGVLRSAYVRQALAHLGYPEHLAVILGVAELVGAVVLIVPCFPRLKEWAYAGAVFTYTGAVASHVAVGDGLGLLAAPLMFAGLTTISWALRPTARGTCRPREVVRRSPSPAGSSKRPIRDRSDTGRIMTLREV